MNYQTHAKQRRSMCFRLRNYFRKNPSKWILLSKKIKELGCLPSPRTKSGMDAIPAQSFRQRSVKHGSRASNFRALRKRTPSLLTRKSARMVISTSTSREHRKTHPRVEYEKEKRSGSHRTKPRIYAQAFKGASL